jgi:Flp pilus assembly protein TadD
MKPAAVEVVQLPEEPAIKPARDVAGPSAKRSPSEAKAAPAPLPPTPPPLISEVPAKEERPGFFQRLNPFRSRRARSGESEAPTPLNAGGKPAASAPQEKTAPAPPALPPPAAITKAEPKIVSEPAPAPKPAPKPVRVAVASPTPLPPKVEETPKPAAAPVPTPPPAPSYPRYKYLNPAPPAAGNRRTAELLFDRGTRAQRDGRFNEAITDYQAALRADPAYFEALYNLGLAAYAAGQTGLSLSAYERGLSINPTHLNARYNFALALQKAGYVRDAASELERLLVDHPLETRAHLTLGNLYSQDLSQNARAREHYQKVLQLDPRHPQAGTIRYWLSSNP